MRTPDTRTGLRALALGGSLMLLAACQTGTDPADGAGSPTTAEASAEPTVAPEVTEPAPQETAAEPVVNGPNSITAPRDGETVTGPAVTVTGEGTAFEATLSYAVLAGGTEDVVLEGFTTAGANGEVGPYSFDVELEPGAYTVRVWEPDMSDGEGAAGPYLNLVEIDITVA